MSRKRAKILPKNQLQPLIDSVVSNSADPDNMSVAFLLSYCAGLRVGEIAGLEWDRHVFPSGDFHKSSKYVKKSDGRISYDRKTGEARIEETDAIWVSADIGKYGKERYIPVSPQLKKALVSWRKKSSDTYVISSRNKGASQKLKNRTQALKMRIIRMYETLEKPGYTSHSGRRTFITQSARIANLHGNSLKDVQTLAGHSDLSTTEQYIELSADLASMLEALYD